MVKLMRYMVMLILALSLLLAGCQGNRTQGLTDPFVGGSTGLTLSFNDATPPAEVYDNKQYPFSVVVKVENDGEYSLTDNDGFIQIEGISPSEFGKSANELHKRIPAIEGSKKGIDGSIIEGFNDVVSFDDLNWQSDIPGTFGPITLRARACYNYETQAVATICVKEEAVDNLDENELCNIAGDKTVYNSGAPIKVTAVRESPQSKESIQVLFTVGSVGSATDSFFKEDTDCDDRKNNPDRYRVWVEVDPIINGQVRARCSGLDGGDQGYITLFDGQPRQISCSFDTSSVNSDFETRVTMKLRYRYSQFIETPLTVRDVSRD